MQRHLLALALLVVVAGQISAQGTSADYARAARLRQTTQNKVFRTSVRPQWLPGGQRFWYRVDVAPDKHEFIVVDAGEGKRTPAFDHQRLAESLAKVLGRDVSAQRLPVDRLTFDEGGAKLMLSAGGKRWE